MVPAAVLRGHPQTRVPELMPSRRGHQEFCWGACTWSVLELQCVEVWDFWLFSGSGLGRTPEVGPLVVFRDGRTITFRLGGLLGPPVLVARTSQRPSVC